MDSEPQSKLLSLVTELMSYIDPAKLVTSSVSKMILLIQQIVSLVNSMDLDLQPKPESKLMSLITQTISLFRSMDLNSQPKPIREYIISFVSQKVNKITSSSQKKFRLFYWNVLTFVEESELISLLYEICYLATSMDPQWEKLIPVCLERVRSEQGKFHLVEEIQRSFKHEWKCLPVTRKKFSFVGGDVTHFSCGGCNGKNHEEEYNKNPVEIKHHLHPKHTLQLVMLEGGETRKCYCCDEDLTEIFYYCSTCDFAMNMICVEKPPALSIDHPKWHEHTLALFPSLASLPCNLCALTHSSCPFYICPPCDFVVHQQCISLPRVIRISRHPHRISFTASFDKGAWCCSVCRRKIDNDYGGYSCSKDGCSYAAHSKCATQRNVWDGIELEGEPEEIEEEVEPPFVWISDGIIQHFSHQHHHLRLDENTCRDYDEDKQCQACILPIYFGKFYSCMQCKFILHETCVNLSRKIHHPIHPHLLTLVGGYAGVIDYEKNECSACHWSCKGGFFYECDEETCSFQLHVQCATISEPLVHESHMHPLFLTSKPDEGRICSVCGNQNRGKISTKETFNCIEECDFALCFGCATLPQKVRYTHDKHILTLSYGEETSTMMYWCEVCEGEINPKERFYMCEEYCCVTIHIDCMLGVDLYMKSGSSWNILMGANEVYVLPNNHHMSRPICYYCEKRCPHKTVIHSFGFILCSTICYRVMMYNFTRNHQMPKFPMFM